jgi:type III pantothenate kinase
MTILAVDIGNTTTKIGSLQDDRRKDFFFKFETAKLIADDKSVREAMLLNLASLESGFHFGIASVVPKATDALSNVIKRTYPDSVIHHIKNYEVPIVNKYHEPDQVGIDRLLAALAAHARFKKDLILVSFGTATTIDCVSRDGEFLGGVIAPGIRMEANALADHTAQLPRIPLKFPPQVLGQTTEQSIQSGVMFGTVAMINGLVAELKQEVFLGKNVGIYTTGGDASSELLQKIRGDEHCQNLVLEGIIATIAKLYE